MQQNKHISKILSKINLTITTFKYINLTQDEITTNFIQSNYKDGILNSYIINIQQHNSYITQNTMVMSYSHSNHLS